MGKRNFSRLATALALAAVLAPPRARAAGQDDTAEPAGRNALDVLDMGILVGGVTGRSPSGRTMLAEAGARALGLRSAGDGGWLVLWDARLAGTTGYAYMASPAPLMVGWRGRAEGRLGRRLWPDVEWSPYLGSRGLLRLQSLRPSRGGRSSLNVMPGGEDLVGASSLGLDAGVSYLRGSRSLLLLVFVQGARRPTDAVPEETFADLGLAARLDLGDRLSASLQASQGWSALRRDRALRSTDRTTHREIDAAIRFGPWRSTWIELEGRASRDGDRLSYAGGRTYRTLGGPDLQVGVAVGTWVWR